MEKKLFLIDAYALIYRAYYALIRAPRTTSRGLNTSAIFGFCNAIDDILHKERPSHIAVCFDPKGGTFRHKAYPQYKAQREAQPEDITLAVPYIKRILAARNIPIYEVPEYEADDVAGTIAKKAEKEGFKTFLMTSDKDYGQLVDDSTFIYRPSSKGGYEVRGIREVCDIYGLTRPEQVIDMLALEGDASDNIPGCPGVGEKTAVKLLSEFDTVEGVIANVDKIKGALQKKISENIEKIRFSKFLVTIKTDVPVDIDFDNMRRREDNFNNLMQIYEELEFRSFIAKIKSEHPEEKESLPRDDSSGAVKEKVRDNGIGTDNTPSMSSLFDETSVAATPPASSPQSAKPTDMGLFDAIDEFPFDNPTVSSVPANVKTIAAGDDAERVLDNVLLKPIVGVCVYAVGHNSMSARLLGVAVSAEAGEAFYVENNDNTNPAIKRLFSTDKTTIVSHDVKRDIIVLHNAGIPFTATYFDTSVAHYILEPEKRHSLRDVIYAFLNHRDVERIDDILTPAKNSPQPADAYQRLGEAADCVRQLMAPLTAAIANEGQSKLLNEIELPFVRVLAEMEIEGVRLDTIELNRNYESLTDRVNEMEEEIFQLAGHRFNVASPMQVGEVLFGEMKIDPKAKRTKTGAFSTTEEILEHHRADHRIVDLILNVRGLRKLLTTYINALPGLINPATGKIHTSFNQTVTATGRISSANPNLQNIPIRTEDGREIRRAFVPDDGCILLSADYSQIELRVIADLSGDPEMVAAFLSGNDIHRSTAAKIYKERIEDVTDEQRRRAKTANFGIIYGISSFGLSERLHIPRSEAKQLIDGYFATYPGIRDYIDSSVAFARENGFVRTIKGRKRMLPDINSRNAVVRGFAERNAVNAPIQGSAADIIKIAMIRIADRIKQEGFMSRMILQVHDELVFNVVADELDRLRDMVIEEMRNAYKGRVPLDVSVGFGANWLEAH